MTHPIVRSSYPTGSELDRSRPQHREPIYDLGVVDLKVVDKKASEHPSAGGTRVILIPTLPKNRKQKRPKRPKR